MVGLDAVLWAYVKPSVALLVKRAMQFTFDLKSDRLALQRHSNKLMTRTTVS